MTASVAGLRSGAGSLDYSASKAAVINMASTGAWQLGKTNIRVNAVCPGLIETGMTAPVFDMARGRGAGSKIGQLNPTGRYGVAEEVSMQCACTKSGDTDCILGRLPMRSSSSPRMKHPTSMASLSPSMEDCRPVIQSCRASSADRQNLLPFDTCNKIYSSLPPCASSCGSCLLLLLRCCYCPSTLFPCASAALPSLCPCLSERFPDPCPCPCLCPFG